MSDPSPVHGSGRSNTSTPLSASRAVDTHPTTSLNHGPPVSDDSVSKDERIVYLTKKVSELESALRDAKYEIRSLRLENRTLADQLVARNPNLYSTSVVMDWIDEDIVPMHAYTPFDSANTKSESVSTRRSRSNVSTNDANRSPVISNRKTGTPRGSRSSPALTTASGPNSYSPHNNTTDVSTSHSTTTTTTRPTSSLGRHISNLTNVTTTGSSSSSSGGVPIKRVLITSDMSLDEHGMPVSPIIVGQVKLVSLGSITPDSGYYNEQNVFPIGYTVQREFMSCTKKDSTTTYNCTILRGSHGPLFRITAADQPNLPHTGNSATDVWTQIIKAANLLCGRHITTKISGPEYYGLNHPLIVHWIQKLPGIEQLTKYRMQEIVIVDDRKTTSSKSGVKRELESSDDDDELMDES